MNNRKIVREKLTSEVITYNRYVPFFRFATVCEHTLIANDEIAPLDSATAQGDHIPIPGCGAMYRLIGDGVHTPTFSSAFKKSSASEAYDNTLNVLNLVSMIYDGADYWYSITQVGV